MAWRGGVCALVALFALAAPWCGKASAASPSFDCAAAAAPVEILICGSDELAGADAALAELYRRLQATLSGDAKTDLLGGQRQWLKSRLAACGIPRTGKTQPAEPDKAASCLIGLYNERLAELTKLADAPLPTVVPVEGQLPTALGLAENRLPATGDQHTILSVAEFGRYAVTVKSAQGVALQLVDRMAGPGPIQGVAGESDGRVDAFLDRGLYKILLQASEQGSGDAAVGVHRFVEQNGPEIPRLPEIRRIDTELGDFEQRSYWLEITSRRIVAIEAAGRNLKDLRLWRDGNWLTDAVPTEDEIEPEPGKPLAVKRIVTTLEPGLYLLSAYGGPELPWAKTSKAHPLHLRMGIPTIADAGRQAFTASPFGIDRYLVPASASYFRIELPEAELASLSVNAYAETAPFDAPEGDTITKERVPPIAEFSLSSADSGYKLITVRREAGKPYVLQHFNAVRRHYFEGSGDYWISTLHSGYGEDSIDATGLLTRRGIATPEEIIADNAPELDRDAVWARRFNLLESATAYFHVTSTGQYVVTSSGADAEFRFEPMIHFPKDYKAPQFQPAGAFWSLDPGYYVLTMRPKSEGKGIIEVKVAAQGVGGAGEDQAKETAALFPRQKLESGFDYSLYLNEQPGVRAGVVLRRLPIDLAAGLPLVLKAGQTLEVPVRAPKDGLVRAIAEDASALKFGIDGADEVTEWRGDGAEHELAIANPTDKAMMASLQFTPDSLLPTTPLPKISPDVLAAIPSFPALVPQEATYFDIAKTEQRTFALDVAEPGLYRVESSGLLQTEGNMRTRTVISLDRQANNGTGRNFLLQQYLGQGSYQVSVGAQGETHGRMGVLTARTVLNDGGALSLGVPARDTIAAGNGLVYTFRIEEAGAYRLQALGLGRTYTMRLEDADGWPIIPPNAPAELAMDFKPGSYRLVILPQPVEAKIVTLLERTPAPESVEGHGPHTLVLNQAQELQWHEPDEGAERVPDQWRFTLPASAHVAIDFSRGMRADLVGEDGETLNEVIGGETWSGELPTGTYTLRATTLEPNNRFDYTVSVTATELVAGQSRVANLPADIPLSIGSDSVVEIGSFGVTDVRAWLYDSDDRLVASNDDRPNDWNFAIAGRLPPGYYKLHLEAVGSAPSAPEPEPAITDTIEDGENDQMYSEEYEGEGEAEAAAQVEQAVPGQTTVSIYQPEEQTEPVLAVGSDTEYSGPKVHIVPLTAAPGDLLVAAADASGPAVGLGLERQENGAWLTLSESVGRSPWVAVSRNGNNETYRLRVWSVDRSTDPIRLQTRMVTQAPVAVAQLVGKGVGLTLVEGIEPALGFAAVTNDAPGAYRLATPVGDLAWSTQNGHALTGDATSIFFGNQGTFWFGARATDPATVRASKLVPGEKPVALTAQGSLEAPTIIADPVASNGGPVLWLAESRLGQPGLDADRAYGGGVALNSTVAVHLGSEQKGFAVKLWNAGDSATPLPVELRRVSFAKPNVAPLAWGATDLTVNGNALEFTLPPGTKRLQFALPPQTAVVLLGGKVADTLWSGDQNLAITQDSNAVKLLILHAGSQEARVGVVATPLLEGADSVAWLTGGRLFRQYYAAEGVTRVKILLSDKEIAAAKAGAMPTLRVAGAVNGLTLARASGTVSREAAPKVDISASVDIAHGVGPIVAWLDGGDPLTAPDPGATAIEVKDSSAVKIEGEAQPLVFSVDAPKFLHLRTTVPVITQLEPTETSQNLRLFPNGADLNFYLPKGTTPLVLRAAGNGPLAGTAEATLIDIAPIGEGLGPKVRLAPGESRLYSFTVKDERDIGVGVRGATDTAHCRVLDAEGNQVGSGVVQMLHLKAGTYLLAVDAPAEGSAIEVQPALVGVAAPDGSPPDDVKRRYLEMAGLKPK